MSNIVVRNITRIILFVLIQVLVFKQIALGGAEFNYFHILVYPIAIMLLPIDTPNTLVLLIAFVVGLSVDMFYDSPGLHAASLVFMAFLRPLVLRALTPDTGYMKNSFPVASFFGLLWYIQYTGILLFIFCFMYFSLEAFTMVYILSILLKTFFSFLVSYAIIILHQIILNPRQ